MTDSIIVEQVREYHDDWMRDEGQFDTVDFDDDDVDACVEQLVGIGDGPEHARVRTEARKYLTHIYA